MIKLWMQDIVKDLQGRRCMCRLKWGNNQQVQERNIPNGQEKDYRVCIKQSDIYCELCWSAKVQFLNHGKIEGEY